MTAGMILLTGTLALPLILLTACLWPSARERMLPWLAWAPLPALLAALVVDRGTTVTLISAGSYTGVLALDTPGALLLGVAALLWSAAGAYAAAYQREQPNRGRFAASWLLCLTGCLGVFVAADMPTAVPDAGDDDARCERAGIPGRERGCAPCGRDLPGTGSRG